MISYVDLMVIRYTSVPRTQPHHLIGSMPLTSLHTLYKSKVTLYKVKKPYHSACSKTKSAADASLAGRARRGRRDIVTAQSAAHPAALKSARLLLLHTVLDCSRSRAAWPKRYRHSGPCTNRSASSSRVSRRRPRSVPESTSSSRKPTP